MFSDYYIVRDWLEGFIPLVYGKEELGLSRIEYLLKLLGNPQQEFKSIHVAGTSGKGSTAYYIAKLLDVSKVSNGSKSSKNLKVGLHISPHLVDIRERMQIFGGIGESEDRRNRRIRGSEESENQRIGGDSLIPMGKFLRLFNEIKPVVEKIQKEKPELTPSYFEILVAASFKYFAVEKVDWAVVEVGLGGRLDATNVLMPEVAVITNIGLDHTEILGDTVEKIAAEKAGIIKPGVQVVTGATGSALRVIEKVAKEKKSKVIRVKSLESREGNFVLAMKAVEMALGYPSNEVRSLKKSSRFTRTRNDLTLTGLPGRFEEIDEGVILDGAHNPDKIRSLIEFLRNKEQETGNKKRIAPKSIILVLAFKKGKDWQTMINLLVKNLPIKSVIVTHYQSVTDTGKGSAVDPREIVEYKSPNFKAKAISNSQEAVFSALNSRSYKTNQLVLVTGSLYLVGEVRTMWYLPEF